MLTVITPTGGRPEAFALCEKWVARQTLQPDEWLVVDDCDPPTKMTMRQRVIRPTSLWAGGNTQFRNMILLLEAVKTELVVVVEDDDYVGPRYLEQQVQRLEQAPLTGETPSRYFNVHFRTYRQWNNTEQASFCQTAFRSCMIPHIIQLCHAERWLDLNLWQNFGKSHGYLSRGDQVVGIKGMPGRGGVTVRAHAMAHSAGWQSDPDMQVLRQWIGKDCDEYQCGFRDVRF